MSCCWWKDDEEDEDKEDYVVDDDDGDYIDVAVDVAVDGDCWAELRTVVGYRCHWLDSSC